MSGSGISWAICKSAHRSRQITTPAHHSVFYRVFYRMPFLPPNQQCQSTEGIIIQSISQSMVYFFCSITAGLGLQCHKIVKNDILQTMTNGFQNGCRPPSWICWIYIWTTHRVLRPVFLAIRFEDFLLPLPSPSSTSIRRFWSRWKWRRQL